MFHWLANRNVRTRLTAWYTLILGAVLIVFSVAIIVLLERSLEDGLNDSVDDRMDSLATLLVIDDGRPAFPDALIIAESFEFDDDDAVIDDPIIAQDEEPWSRTYGVDGELVSNAGAHPALPDPDDMIAEALAGTSSRTTIGTGEESFSVLVRPVIVESEIIGAIEVALPREDLVETVDALISNVILAVPLALAFATLGGWFLARRALQPVDRMSALARQISAEDLSQRLDLDLRDDEIGRLARTLDEMIERLDIAFQQQRQFTADASHELRTPLTALKGHIEVTREHVRSAEDYEEALVRFEREVDRLSDLVQRLLVLARADAGQIPIEREYVPVGQFVEAAAEQLVPQAEQREVRLATTPGPDVRIWADESLILQLLLNLIGNALRHTPPDGSVIVRWREADHHVEIDIEDNGSGIDPADLPHVFERFYRADRARSRQEGSTGLGLAISQWIARAHGGWISVKSEPGQGSCFTVHLPHSG